jgi:hypothetical protein
LRQYANEVERVRSHPSVDIKRRSPLPAAATYDAIGHGYARQRRPDPRIAAQLTAALGGAQSVLDERHADADDAKGAGPVCLARVCGEQGQREQLTSPHKH